MTMGKAILILVSSIIIAWLVAWLLLNIGLWIWFKLFTKPSAKDSNDNCETRQYCIYVPKYIQYLRRLCPLQIYKGSIVKSQHISQLDSTNKAPLQENPLYIVNSPVSELKESKSNEVIHAPTISPEKKESNHNGTLPPNH